MARRRGEAISILNTHGMKRWEAENAETRAAADSVNVSGITQQGEGWVMRGTLERCHARITPTLCCRGCPQ